MYKNTVTHIKTNNQLTVAVALLSEQKHLMLKFRYTSFCMLFIFSPQKLQQ